MDTKFALLSLFKIFPEDIISSDFPSRCEREWKCSLAVCIYCINDLAKTNKVCERDSELIIDGEL